MKVLFNLKADNQCQIRHGGKVELLRFIGCFLRNEIK